MVTNVLFLYSFYLLKKKIKNKERKGEYEEYMEDWKA
jgi:hypothetical protein